jgi:hypothetical protein
MRKIKVIFIKNHYIDRKARATQFSGRIYSLQKIRNIQKLYIFGCENFENCFKLPREKQ